MELAAYLAGGGRLAVIKAPPGSGKTHVLISVLAKLVHDSGRAIAVAAQTNSQADDICRRIARREPSIPLTRFAGGSHRMPDGFPEGAAWITGGKDLRYEPGITVSTTAKWALTDVGAPFDLFAVDEAWQLGWADLMQCALISEKFLLIGDPGQISPVVSIDARRWDTSPRAPHAPAPEVVLAGADFMELAHLGSLPACRRLPHEAVRFIKSFYDFDFAPYVEPGASGLELPTDHPLAGLSDGQPIVATLATPAGGPPLEVDHEIATAAATIALDLLDGQTVVRIATAAPRALAQADIGIVSTHRVMNSAIEQALGSQCPGVRVDTPERWQGLQRPVMIAVHPLSGVVDPSAFDLATGRLCVMATRHQAALVILTRDHVGETLANFVPSAEQAPGKPDVTGRGHDAHMRFWEQLVSADRIVALS